MRKRKRVSVGRVILHTFLMAGSLTYIVPIIMMISISLSSEGAIKEFGYTVLPKIFSTQAYESAFANPTQIIQSYKVTIAFSIVSTVLAMLVQSMTAYPLSRPDFIGKKFFKTLLFITMLFSGGLVPSYILNTRYLNLGNSFWIYVLPGLISAFTVFIFMNYFKGLPEGLVESARIDGASEFLIFFKIIIPLSVPIIASLGFMHLLGKWNDWNTALLYIREPRLYSLQYLLQKILNEADYIKELQKTSTVSMIGLDDIPGETLRYAMAVIAAGPMTVCFPFFQKYFAKGLTVGAIKG